MKRIFGAVLTAALVLTLAACGGPANPSGSAAASGSGAAQGSGNPSKPAPNKKPVWPTTNQVELVVPYNAGGDTDLSAGQSPTR